MNIKLIVEYDGTAFHGWQEQRSGARTVQATLTRAIQDLTGEAVTLIAAGRTDAGVHALGQVVNFRLAQPFALDRLPLALNARLEPDLVVRQAAAVPESFHARYSARARTYAYRIRQALPRGAYLRQYAWAVPERLDLETMRAAGGRLCGRHDFQAFGRSPRPGGHTMREVLGVRIDDDADWITILVSADAFLYGMMRRMAGALYEVGRRRRPLGWIDELLGGSGVGLRPAPSHGLVQVGVAY
ncbi:MAG TPA: tRNA pseudouridine(38-40) synthase TruA [Candidatus Limnocylindrales bacterium]|nr:tRNA pseudouridine(38-40) synthase TruA [Candidatus Limnocylindrales bacterium]